MDEIFDKPLTEKQFRDEVTPFIKAYKKKEYGGLDIHENLEVANKSISAGIDKFNDGFALAMDIYDVDEFKPSHEWLCNSEIFEISHKENTITEIVDFLVYEYCRQIKIIKKFEKIKKS